MSRNPTQTNVDLPLKIILVSKDESAERVLFMYPFDSENSCTENDGNELMMPNELDIAHFSNSNEGVDEKLSIPVKVLAPLLCPKEGTLETPFEIKIDNYCFAGYPLKIDNSAHTLAVGFVLPGGALSHIIDSFQKLSKKIAVAISSEQSRCGYLKEQIALMQPAIEEYEVEMESNHQDDVKSPYPSILEKCGLAQHLKEIFNDVREYGMVDVFVDDCIEVGFCIEPKALLQAGLTPKSSKEVDKIMRQVRPYHGILFLEDTLPSPDSNPFVMSFLNEYEPDRSIEKMSKSAGLPLNHVLLIVKHYLKWARAIIIYPICNSNVYTIASNNMAFQRVSATFYEMFDCSLAEILELFSPPCSLEAFRNDTLLYTPINVRMKMMVFLLRNQLIVQLHTYFVLLPPFSNQPLREFDPTLLSARCRTLINERKDVNEEIKANLIRICGELQNSGEAETEIFWLLSSFVIIIPLLNGRHHFEDIMYTKQLDRTNARRILDTFSPILATFCNRDLIAE